MQQIAFITGASSGLGREIALHFARGGYRVLAGVRRLEDGAALQRIEPGIAPVILDLNDPEQIEAAARRINEEAELDGLSVLVNAAGYQLLSPVAYSSAKDIRRLFEVMVFAPAALTNALLPALRRFGNVDGRRAKVINIISWAALDASPFAGVYAAAKAAFLRLSQTQYYEFSSLGIDAIAVMPGLMRTPMIDAAGGQIEQTLRSLPEEGRRDYGRQLVHMANMSRSPSTQRMAARPETFAQRIFEIVKKQSPKAEYKLGTDTVIVAIMNAVLPFFVLRAIKRSIFALNQQ
jgi:NAD(P)-dependent dehydrogenase (short-subunit alcohol dehydrogenase family)